MNKNTLALHACALVLASPALAGGGQIDVRPSAATAVSGTVAIDQTTPGTSNAVAVKAIGAATVATGNGVVGTGVQRVAIASDNTAFAVNATENGNVANDAADSGNPVKMGARYDSSVNLPSATGGRRYDTLADSFGNTRVVIAGTTYGAVDASLSSGSASYILRGDQGANQPGMLQVGPQWWDGTNWWGARGDKNVLSVGKGLTSTRWRYTSGISPILSNTTAAVTIKTAAGAGVKNVIDSCQIGSTALGASVPFAFRDGAGGSVMWAVRPPTAGWLSPFTVVFEQPLVGTANTLIEVVTTTADTSGTFDVNCQGHTEL